MNSDKHLEGSIVRTIVKGRVSPASYLSRIRIAFFFFFLFLLFSECAGTCTQATYHSTGRGPSMWDVRSSSDMRAGGEASTTVATVNSNCRGQKLSTFNKYSMHHQNDSILYMRIANIPPEDPKNLQLENTFGDVSRASLKKLADLNLMRDPFAIWSFQIVEKTSKCCRNTGNSVFAKAKKFQHKRRTGDVSRASLKKLADLSLIMGKVTTWSFQMVEMASKGCRNTAYNVFARLNKFQLKRIIKDVSRATMKKLQLYSCRVTKLGCRPMCLSVFRLIGATTKHETMCVTCNTNFPNYNYYGNHINCNNMISNQINYSNHYSSTTVEHPISFVDCCYLISCVAFVLVPRYSKDIMEQFMCVQEKQLSIEAGGATSHTPQQFQSAALSICTIHNHMTSKYCKITDNTVIARPKRFQLERIIGDVSRATLKNLAVLSQMREQIATWRSQLVENAYQGCRTITNTITSKPKKFQLKWISGNVSRATLKKLADLRFVSFCFWSCWLVFMHLQVYVGTLNHVTSGDMLKHNTLQIQHHVTHKEHLQGLKEGHSDSQHRSITTPWIMNDIQTCNFQHTTTIATISTTLDPLLLFVVVCLSIQVQEKAKRSSNKRSYSYHNWSKPQQNYARHNKLGKFIFYPMCGCLFLFLLDCLYEVTGFRTIGRDQHHLENAVLCLHRLLDLEIPTTCIIQHQNGSKLCRITTTPIIAKPKKFQRERIIGDVSRATLKNLAVLSQMREQIATWRCQLVKKAYKCCRTTTNTVISNPKKFQLKRIIGNVSRATLKKLADLRFASVCLALLACFYEFAGSWTCIKEMEYAFTTTWMEFLIRNIKQQQQLLTGTVTNTPELAFKVKRLLICLVQGLFLVGGCMLNCRPQHSNNWSYNYHSQLLGIQKLQDTYHMESKTCNSTSGAINTILLMPPCMVVFACWFMQEIANTNTKLRVQVQEKAKTQLTYIRYRPAIPWVVQDLCLVSVCILNCNPQQSNTWSCKYHSQHLGIQNFQDHYPMEFSNCNSIPDSFLVLMCILSCWLAYCILQENAHNSTITYSLKNFRNAGYFLGKKYLLLDLIVINPRSYSQLASDKQQLLQVWLSILSSLFLAENCASETKNNTQLHQQLPALHTITSLGSSSWLLQLTWWLLFVEFFWLAVSWCCRLMELQGTCHGLSPIQPPTPSKIHRSPEIQQRHESCKAAALASTHGHLRLLDCLCRCTSGPCNYHTRSCNNFWASHDVVIKPRPSVVERRLRRTAAETSD